MRSQWDFIEEAARKLGVGSEALRKWRVRGVPDRHRLSIVDEARAQRFRLDRGAFDRPPGPRSLTTSGPPGRRALDCGASP